jgi:hypothetical protein
MSDTPKRKTIKPVEFKRLEKLLYCAIRERDRMEMYKDRIVEQILPDLSEATAAVGAAVFIGGSARDLLLRLGVTVEKKK